MQVGEINHPVVREALKYMDIQEGLEIHHDGDLPARSGLGTSSAFTVGLLSALHTLKGEQLSKLELALEAIYVERELVKEVGGIQDQLASCFGGLNFMQFGEANPLITRINVSPKRLDELNAHLMLVFTGFPHFSSDIAKSYNFNKDKEITEMMRMAKEAVKILREGDLKDFGKMLDEAWQLKKSLSGQISNPYIDYVYSTAKEAGAIGGKLNGSGGGGFMMLFAEPDKQAYIREKLGGLLYVPFKFDFQGVQTVLNNGGDA